MDTMIYTAQQWLNATYTGRNGYNKIEPDGITGWSTMRALTRALQIELGIAEPSDNFGDQTLSLCPTISINSPQELIIDTNIVRILQSAMYCKGYSAGEIDGVYDNEVKSGIQQMQSDAGLSNPDGIVIPLIFKALLTMDAYVILAGGDANIRTIQRNLNRDYFPGIGELIPCDGIYGRTTSKSMILAIQIEGNIPEPNGVWGPATIASLPLLTYGNTKKAYNFLLQYALYANGFSPNGFDGYYGNGCRTAVRNFQTFCALTVDGSVGQQTWSSLMISKGDTSRNATACDCSSTVTPERANTIYNHGYRIVGRYLTGGWKEIKSGEIQTLFDAGLSIFPIYQTSGSQASYFNYGRGGIDAAKAIIAAKKYGFKPGTIIYFAVDFDALDYHVSNNIVPYFRGIYNQFYNLNSGYRIGIYGPRNVCSRIGNNGFSCSSFVSDMSTGFSGNLGYPLPSDWNFDQILEYYIGTGDGQIAIDKNVCKGNYTGENSVIQSSGATTSDIVAIANSLDGVVNRMGMTFTSPDVKISLFTFENIEISASFSVSSVFGEVDGISAVVQNGQITGVESQVYDVTGAFGIDSVSLESKISSWEGIDFIINMTQTGNSTTISLINQFNAEYFDGVGYFTEQIDITIKNLNQGSLQTQISNAYDSVVSWADENSSELIIGLCIIAGIVVTVGVIIGLPAIIAALGSIAQALASYAIPIVFMLFFVNKIFEELLGDDVS